MQSFLSIPRVWDPSQQAIFNRHTAGREGENTEKGTLFLCLLRKFFIFYVLISLYGEKTILPNLCKRKVQIKFYVTEEERALIEQKMKLVPTQNMAAYLRKIAIDGYIIQTDHSDIKAMTAEIQKIGVNINQIAKRVNATGSVYQEDIEEIKGVLAEIWRLQRLSLLKAR